MRRLTSLRKPPFGARLGRLAAALLALCFLGILLVPVTASLGAEEPAPAPEPPTVIVVPAEPAAPGPEAPAAPGPEAPPAAPQPEAPKEPAPAPPPGPRPAPLVTPAPTGPISSAPLRLNFQDASLDSVLAYLSEKAGLAVVREAPVEGRITVFALQPLTVEQAISLLNTMLKEKGYVAIRMNNTLKIVKLEDAKRRSIPVRTGSDPSKIEPSDEVITQVIPLRVVDAVQLRRDLLPLIPTYADLTANASSNSIILTDTAVNVRRIVEIIKSLDTSTAASVEVRVFHLTYADATSAARLINDVFQEEDQAAQRRGVGAFGAFGGAAARFFAGGAGRGGGMGDPGAQAQGQEAGATRPQRKVKASADDRTNSVVVSAPPDMLKVIEQVVKDLDANPAQEQAVYVYKLRNGNAANLEGNLNSLFGGGTTGGRRTTTGTQRSTGGTTTSSQRTGGTTSSSRGGSTSSQGGGATSSQRTGGATSSQRGGGGFGGGFGALSGTARQAASSLLGQVYVVADPDTNSLMVLTAPKNYEQVKQIIAELDRPVPQVLIKALIAEVTHENERDLGVEFSALNLRSDGSGSEIFSGFNVASETTGVVIKHVEENTVGALRALERVGKLDVLSRPYVLASDNQLSAITVGESVPFIRDTRITTDGSTINTINYEDIGIILQVTPHINFEKLVISDIYLEISSITDSTVPISETVNAAVISKRSASCRIAIRDGQTIVIGGLMDDRKTDTVQKVPLLGDIPYLGWLFRRTTVTKVKKELLIFLTPHVAQDTSVLPRMTEDEKAGMKIVPDAVEPGTFQDHMKGMERGGTPSEEKQTDKDKSE